ncbi:uncharacterized protein LOC131253399 isoform X2 [Magnolia sinica]|uniref:uncharacterized protein LOC131253399 isoform X2 n=1 Tax=Magnolia sinica TaxID=86752 RepID=UPI002658FDA5|nr:uncharacterized protein LOC131253399 isoform X2 [Magnolia sinica]
MQDDPVCVTAQGDGKILITDIWVDDRQCRWILSCQINPLHFQALARFQEVTNRYCQEKKSTLCRMFIINAGPGFRLLEPSEVFYQYKNHLKDSCTLNEAFLLFVFN